VSMLPSDTFVAEPVDDVSRVPFADEFTFATFAKTGWSIVDGRVAFDVSDSIQGEGNTLCGVCDAANDGYPILLWRIPESQRGTLRPTASSPPSPCPPRPWPP